MLLMFNIQMHYIQMSTLQSAWNDLDLLLLFFWVLEIIWAKQKKKKSTIFSKGTILSLVHQFLCVCVCFCFLSVIFFFSFLLGSGGRVRKPRQHSCIISAITWPSRQTRPLRGRINICIFSLPEGASGSRDVGMWAAGRRTDLWIHTTLIKVKKKKKKKRHQCFRPHMQRYSHTTM